jgi:membrane protein insertase Oxa1/YidC/SpoIIIJ
MTTQTTSNNTSSSPSINNPTISNLTDTSPLQQLNENDQQFIQRMIDDQMIEMKQVPEDGIFSFLGSYYDTIINSTIINTTVDLFLNLQYYTNLPWWLTLIVGCLLFRMTTIPLTIYTIRIGERLKKADTGITSMLQIASLSKLSINSKKKILKDIRRNLIKTYKCHPTKLVIPTIVAFVGYMCVAMASRK